MRAFLFSACLCAAVVFSADAACAEGGAAQALAFTWTGLYGGINGVYARQNSDWDFDQGGSASMNDNTGGVGLQVGYDAQLTNNFFAGLEGSLEAARLDGTTSCLGGSTCYAHLSSFGDVALRLGVTSGQTLFYAKGGWAYEDVTHHIITGGVNYHDGGGGQPGYLIGAGAEYALMYNLTTKLEYNYMYFGSSDYAVSSTEHVDTKNYLNVVKLGFNLKFD